MYLVNPSFFDNALTIFNCIASNLIKDIIKVNQSRVMHYTYFDVYYFDRDFYIVQITDPDITLQTLMSTNESNNYMYALGSAFKNDGIFANIVGHNVFYFATIIAKYTNFSVENVLTAVQNGMNAIDDPRKEKYEKDLKLMIPKLYQFAVDHKQVKNMEDDYHSNLKGYCDSDFYIYMYDNKFMIACYASATMYMVEFTPTGFVVYGENNDYGKELEELNNPDFDWDTADFEPYFFKYLHDGMIIFEVDGDKAVAKNPIIDMFYNIVEYILDDEKLMEKPDK